MPEQTCVDCHFIFKMPSEKYMPRGKSLEDFKNPLTKGERNKIREKYTLHNSKDFVKGGETVACYLHNWDLQHNPRHLDREGQYKEIAEKERNDCSFLNFKEDILLLAGKEIQEREEEKAKYEKDLKHTRWAIYIAAASLFIGALFEALNFFCKP